MNRNYTQRMWIGALGMLLVFNSCASFGRGQRNNEEPETEEQGMGYYQRQEKVSASDHPNGSTQPKKRVLILKFWNDTPVQQEGIGDIAASELMALLEDSNRVILPSEDSKPMLKTEDFIQGDKIRVAQLVAEGRKQGVTLVVIGRVARISLRQKGDEVGLLRKQYTYAGADLEIKLFDVQVGREILATMKSGEVSDSALSALQSKGLEDPHFRAELTAAAVRQASSGFVPEILKTLDKTIWQGHVAKVEGKSIFLNAGRASGLIMGDILKVFGTGDDIYDPTTGAYLGRSQGHLKGTLEMRDFVGMDGGLAQIHTGGNVQEGDLVQLY